MATLNVSVESKTVKANFNGNITIMRNRREAANYKIFKQIPNYGSIISSDFANFGFIRDLFADKCETTITRETLSDGIDPIMVPKAQCTGSRCSVDDCRCNPIKITYQLVKRTGRNAGNGKHMNQLIFRDVTVAFKPGTDC